MAKYNSPRDGDENDPIFALLKLPVKNLEAKVKQLESEIDTRKQLSNKALSTLATRILRLQDQLELMRYLSVFDPGFAAIRDFQSQISKLETLKITESRNCFTDLLGLSEKLLDAKHDFETEKLKLGLFESDDKDNE